MATKRSYSDPCGVARALDIVGERWALLIVRELLLGPKRFTDLRAGLPTVGPDVLSLRLRELEQAGLLRRRTLPPPAASRVYELTDRGRQLEPVLIALGHWGSGAAFPVTDRGLSIDAFMLALKTLFDSRAAAGLNAVYELHIDQQTFVASVADGRFELARGSAQAPDATIASDPATLSDVLWHGGSLSDSLRAGRVELGGSSNAVTRFMALFAPPQPASVS